MEWAPAGPAPAMPGLRVLPRPRPLPAAAPTGLAALPRAGRSFRGARAGHRRRVWRRRRSFVLACASGELPGTEAHEVSWPALQARRRRWAELLRRVFRV